MTKREASKKAATPVAADEGPSEILADINAEPPEADDNAGQDFSPVAAPREYSTTLTAKEKKAKKVGKTTRIILEENEEIPPTGLYLGHNGRGYVIATGKEVDVPDFLIEILDHAIMSKPIIDPQTRQTLGWRDRMRYSYRKVS